jgi:5-methyltetrahydropteroyltriglutamate--homocysteine methyltransferase
MTIAANLGFPRIGPRRELKRALEDHWFGRTGPGDLASAARSIRRANWETQARAGIDHIPSGDFSFYDHVLDTAVMLGAVPERFRRLGGTDAMARYFAMARGTEIDGEAIPAMEMTKWFDTNYHYIVPELEDGMELHLASSRVVDEFLEAKELGILTRPVILGPISFLLLAKSRSVSRTPLDWLREALPVYEQLLAQLYAAGAGWVQMDEPCLVLDLDSAVRRAYREVYERLGDASVRVALTSYFGGLGENLATALELPVAALHLDLVRAPEQLDAALDRAPDRLALSLGVVDGRNVWRTDLDAVLGRLSLAASRLGPDRLMVAPSCSLLHVPVDLDGEEDLDDELSGWLAFGEQKLHEISVLVRALDEGSGAVENELAESRGRVAERRASPRIHVPAVAARERAVQPVMLERASFAERSAKQADALALPLLPTTTIGSFPQTLELRRARAAFRAGSLSRPEYDAIIRGLIQDAIRFQEKAGLDVLVHGEFERNDMVEFFGERLSGFAFTRNGWVQSYGSRCVTPPVIFGDVARPRPMTVAWTVYAQSLTHLPVKGMLTGPVTMLQWSFVRDDQPRERTCRQLALAIRDETLDLEAAGVQVIQIDEPAIREGLPLRASDRGEYLRWAVEAFRLASSGVREETQIHTHMCYSEFDDIIDAVARMDADVLSIETSRSDMELLDTFGRTGYPNAVGPGVYDVHSPVVPETDAIEALLLKALAVLAPEQLWVNPDCGLKTRRWEEVRPAMAAMVAAARRARERLGGAGTQPGARRPAARAL